MNEEATRGAVFRAVPVCSRVPGAQSARLPIIRASPKQGTDFDAVIMTIRETSAQSTSYSVKTPCKIWMPPHRTELYKNRVQISFPYAI